MFRGEDGRKRKNVRSTVCTKIRKILDIAVELMKEDFKKGGKKDIK